MSVAGNRRGRSSITDRAGDRERGFTLLEMLVAVAIMSLITGICFPAIERLSSRQQFAAASDAVLLALIEARGDAISQGRPVRVTLAAGRQNLLSTTRVPAALPASVNLSWPKPGFTFFPDGGASGGQVVIDGAGRSRRIAVDPDTARVTISA